VSVGSVVNRAEETREAEWLKRWLSFLERREEQVFLGITLLIGALVGLAVVAFIVLTERLGMRLYPVGSAA